jgi:predicted nucleotidyltransferase
MVRIRIGWLPLVDVLQRRHDAIVAACTRHGVARLEAFGSALRQDFKHRKSDLDLMVDFRPMDSYARVGAYFGLLDQLWALLEGEVDLVMVGAIKNPYIARNIARTKQLLCATGQARLSRRCRCFLRGDRDLDLWP